MPNYCFFRKGQHIALLECSDESAAAQLLQQGYEKQFEEIEAVNANSALARFADIRQEEVKTEHAFATGSTFGALLTAIFK